MLRHVDRRGLEGSCIHRFGGSTLSYVHNCLAGTSWFAFDFYEAFVWALTFKPNEFMSDLFSPIGKYNSTLFQIPFEANIVMSNTAAPVLSTEMRTSIYRTVWSKTKTIFYWNINPYLVYLYRYSISPWFTFLQLELRVCHHHFLLTVSIKFYGCN